MKTQNGRNIPPNHDWWMYIWVGLAAGMFIHALIKWWFYL